MRSIGVFGEPVCKCACTCVCVFMRGTVQVGPNCERGLERPEHRHSAPPRARWTEGMRYIVKPKNQISVEKRKTKKEAQQTPSRGVQPPVKNKVRLRNLRNLSRTKTKNKIRGLLFYPN